jgi:non-canonical purine NTP pyrophosphatase (RdgB/HAM1 family)
MSKIYFVTSSSNKFREANSIIPVLERINIDLPEIQSLQSEEIIKAKLITARQHTQDPLVVEDTGLYMDGINGLPGPFIKFFVEKLTTAGLANLAISTGNHLATARTVIGYSVVGKEPILCEGLLKGRIVSPRGQGFGWDSIFEPEGFNLTLGEMELEQKLKISMRGIAFRDLKTRI